MRTKSTIDAETLANVRVLHYPDPRLRQKAVPLTQAQVDDSVRALAERMHELMAEHRGVGLAATQLGVPVRLFVANPTGESADRRTYINPRVVSYEGSAVTEEGCLSVPGVHTKIKRHLRVSLEALDLDGRRVCAEAEGLSARIFQHEIDHLDGKLLVDRMGTLAKISHRAALQQLEEEFADSQKSAAK